MSQTQDLEIDRAARALEQGRLVAFPTETVYGLGANAENEAAVARVFAVKGRPSNHPLIVHIARAEELHHWATDVPEVALRLAAACWPGPLTLLLRKAARVPLATTGGLQSVGLRVPAHPVALALLRRFGGGIAAPSANRFGCVSPTTAAHVRADLGEDVDVVLDGGACEVGVESTIVDLTGERAVLLRPGGVTAERIESLIGIKLGRHASEDTRAPGMLPSHYAPRARVEVVPPASLAARAAELSSSGLRVVVLLTARDRATGAPEPRSERASHGAILVVDLGDTEEAAAQRLYAGMRQADLENADVVLAAVPEARGLSEALADRLLKAAGPRET